MDWATTGHSLFTVFCFLFFVIVFYFAYSKRSKNRYDEAANLPFLEDSQNTQNVDQTHVSNGAKK